MQPLSLTQNSSVQGLLSLHLSVGPPTQAPAARVSAVVQPSPSLQATVLAVLVQPLTLSQASSVQGLPSPQSLVLPGTHLPSVQPSPTVQTLPSVQGWLLASCLQPPGGAQESVVHGFWSSQSVGVPAPHLPAPQTSPEVHLLPLSQGLVLATVVQPSILSQPSLVHGLPSSQLCALPPPHLPPVQTSPRVQASPSLQVRLLLATLQPPAASQVSVVHGLASSHGANLPG